MKNLYEKSKKIIIAIIVTAILFPIVQYAIQDRRLETAQAELKSRMESLQIATTAKNEWTVKEAVEKDGVCKKRSEVAAIKLNMPEFKNDEVRLKKILADCFYDFS